MSKRLTDRGSRDVQMLTVAHAMTDREILWSTVTAVLPLIDGEFDEDREGGREWLRPVFAALGLHASSDRDVALITGAMELAKWVRVCAEMVGATPERTWQNYMDNMQGCQSV
jgi:hypothetical protein